MKKAIALLAALAANTASSQPVSFFADALTSGKSTMNAPVDATFSAAQQVIQQKTGSSGELQFIAWRIQKFTQQSKCGRVGFVAYQPSTGTAFPEIGGELNICEDGMPPLRECAAIGLVPVSAKCPDGSAPSDTKEVRDAISDAIKRGGLTYAQVSQMLKTNKGVQK